MTHLIQFVSELCNAGAKRLDTVDNNCSYGGSSEGLVVDDIDLLGQHVQEEASA